MKRIKKILSLAIAAITAAAAITAQAAQFTDLGPDHWAYNSVTKMAERGVFSGYEDGTFRPEQSITHEEFIKTIVEYVAPGSVTPKDADYRQVITNDPSNPQYWTNHWEAWAQPYLDKALELGLIGDGSDASNKKIATLLDDYDEIINGTTVEPWHGEFLNTENGVTGKFTYDFIPVSLEIDLDDTDNIAPNTPITREEAARLVTRALYLTHDNDHLYESVNNTSFKYEFPYTLSYKYASTAICYKWPESWVNFHGYSYSDNLPLAGVICNIDIDTGLTEGNGVWGVTPNYRRDVLVALLNGIIGTDENGMYNPQQSLTRAEAAAIALRLSDKNERFVNDDNNSYYLRHAVNSAYESSQNKYYIQISNRIYEQNLYTNY